MRKDFSKRLAEIVGKNRLNELHQRADISAQISKGRKQQNISQQKLAESIGVAKSTIGRIETGMTSPNTSTLYKVSDVLNISFVIDGTANQDKEIIKS